MQPEHRPRLSDGDAEVSLPAVVGLGEHLALMTLWRPTDAHVAQVVASSADLPWTYEDVGATRDGAFPAGWTVESVVRVIGRGQAAFERGVAGLRRWEQFDVSWVEAVDTSVAVEPDAMFGFVARSYGVWSINVCRIVYVLDEVDEGGARFGLGYGTVGAHSVRGEERFLLSWDRTTDEVSFGVSKFSLPANVLLKVVGPLTRRVQRRFTFDAIARMAQVVTP